MNTEIAAKRRLSDFIAEYDEKIAGVDQAIAEFERAGTALKTASCIAGTWGNETINTGSVYAQTLKRSLLTSAWSHTYKHLQIDRVASATDKQKFEQAMAAPAPFTLENIRATFGSYIADPRGNILRGLAEVFCSLDPAYKSHDKVKIGVKGLPKRVILPNVSSFGWGQGRLRDILNALAAYQGKPLVEYVETAALLNNEDALLAPWTHKTHDGSEVRFPERGVRLRRFENGNGHLFFEPLTLADINFALSEYYGAVLADCTDDDEPKQKRASTEVSKDLQYYPTPAAVVEQVLSSIYIKEGERVLEPSCGCGRFLDALRAKKAVVIGVEVDPGRAAQCKAKGHSVMLGNFLETVPTGDFDRVVMNPPFYGRHYAKHVRHALRFLKPGGTLTAILPITARYDHGELDDLLSGCGRYSKPWHDLPVGSFSESGTNINTTVLTLQA